VSVVDLHNHFFPERWPDWDAKFGGEPWPRIRHDGVSRDGVGMATVMLGEREFRRIDERCWNVARRIEDMDRDGIDLQVISATPVLFAYGRPAAEALEAAKFYNDAALELCARSGGRLAALCQVPLQDPDRAATELSRCMQAGHLGVQIGNHVGAKDFDDAGIVAFLQHCAAEGAAVLVHPWDMLGGERTKRFMMAWTVSMPAETQLTLVAMILGGAFDRLPRSLKLCFAHGGGSFAFLLGRLENAWHHHPAVKGVSQHPPAHYCDRFYLDTAVFSPDALALLIKTVGEDRVMLGSDYPFPLGEQQVGRLVREASFLGAAQKRKLLGDNARAFLGLERPNVAARAAE
jgi:aminocarboxymuconate-semialdehyde decarboxylase